MLLLEMEILFACTLTAASICNLVLAPLPPFLQILPFLALLLMPDQSRWQIYSFQALVHVGYYDELKVWVSPNVFEISRIRPLPELRHFKIL